MVRFGFWGAGRVVQNRYVDVFSKELQGASVSAVCDIDRPRADHVAAALGAKAIYDDQEFLQRPDIDAVIICTESGHHHNHVRRALKAGKHVVVEKPPAMFSYEVGEDAQLAKDKGLMYAPVFQNRLNPAVVKLKQTVDEGRFGKIVLATVRLRWCRTQDYYEDGWHGTWAMDGGVINQQAIHHVDVLRWIGGEVQEVYAMQANALNRLEAEDTTVAVLKFKNGALGVIEATTAARPNDHEASFSIVAQKGYAQIGGIALNKMEAWRFVEPKPADDSVCRQFSQEVPTGYGLSHGPLMQLIIDRLKAGNTTSPLAPETVTPTVELVHALYKSTEDKKSVKVGPGIFSSRLGRPC